MIDEWKTFENFRVSGLHTRDIRDNWFCNWPKMTYCVIKIKNDDEKPVIEILKSQPGLHAEIQAIQAIEIIYIFTEWIRRRSEPPCIVVDMYLNYSPCSDCAQQLLDFIDNATNTSMNIYFVQLYNAKRRSCEIREDRCYGDGAEPELKCLYDCSRIKIRNFYTKEIWSKLGQILGLGCRPFRNSNERESRLKEDREVAKDFQFIINSQVFGAFYCSGLHSRYGSCKQQETCCVSKIHNGNGESKTFIISSDREETAEEKIVDCLENYIEENCIQKTATIYMNHSPSRYFLNELMNFNEIYFNIRFVKLEGVPHHLCGPQCKTPTYTRRKKRNNKIKIQDMNRNNCDTISCFKKKTWKTLATILDVNIGNWDMGLRYEEDVEVEEAFNKLLEQ